MGIFDRKRSSGEGKAALVEAKAIYLSCKKNGTSNKASQEMTVLLNIAREHGLNDEAERLLNDYVSLIHEEARPEHPRHAKRRL